MSGAEGAEGAESGVWLWQKYVLVLRAFDPWWHGRPVEHTWADSESQPFLGSTFLPLRIGPDQALGELVMSNPGDVDAHPVWTIDGPMTELVLEVDGGPRLTLDHSLDSDGRVVIDTRPGVLTVVDDAGANLWPDLSAGSSLWALPPGETPVTIDVSGSGSATRVSVGFEPRYATA